MSRIIRICAMGCGLLGALVASQGPEFSQQYRQRLGGAYRRTEAGHRTLRRGRQSRCGETPESAITRLRGNADDLASRQGTAMQGNVERLGQARVPPPPNDGSRLRSGASPDVRDGDTDILNAAYGISSRPFRSPRKAFSRPLRVLWWPGAAFCCCATFIRSLFRRRRSNATTA